MNMFVLDRCPIKAAQMHCDKHVVKMCVEVMQMIGSALRRHGATDSMMPLTQKGTPMIGGYKHHPVTRWCGDSRANFEWACKHGIALCEEYTHRYGKRHSAHDKILQMQELTNVIPDGKLTSFAQAMPDEYKHEDAVVAYKRYYWYDKRENISMTWKCDRKPRWFKDAEFFNQIGSFSDRIANGFV